jgi:hypothetical protein
MWTVKQQITEPITFHFVHSRKSVLVSIGDYNAPELQLAYPIHPLPSQNEVDARVAVQFGDNRTLFVLPN